MKYFLLLLLVGCTKLSLAQSTRLDEFKILVQANDSMGEDHPDLALKNSMQLITLAEQLHQDSLLYVALKSKVSALGLLGIYDEGLKELFRMKSIRERNLRVDPSGELFLYFSLNYFSMSDFKNAYHFATRYKEEAVRSKEYGDTMEANLQIGLTLIGLEQEDGFAMVVSLKVCKGYY